MLPRGVANAVHAAREYLTPVLADASFDATGQLSPPEFVLAGDKLVALCPSWAWGGGPLDALKPYLPVDKQFLVTRGVPCSVRAAGIAAGAAALVEVDRPQPSGDVWVEAAERDDARPMPARSVRCSDDDGGGGGDGEYDDLVPASSGSIGGPTPATRAQLARPSVQATSSAVDDEYADLVATVDPTARYVDPGAVEPPPAAVAVRARVGRGVRLVRRYDMFITYDNAFRTPRCWLRGFGADGAPLSPAEMLDDVFGDYRGATATVEAAFPHAAPRDAGPCISIHPCRHAESMKALVTRVRAGVDGGGGGPAAGAGSALFVFLKLIAAAIPGIEYDQTLPVSAAMLGGAPLRAAP